MTFAESQLHWDDMAELDPYWSILTEPGTRYGKWDVEIFLATGEAEIGSVLESGRQWGLPHRCGCALDFGCGVGRLTRALAKRFDKVVGLDISSSMLHRAAELNDGSNVSFVVNASPSLPFAAETFDLIYTAIVLQHVTSRPAIRSYVGEFIRTLKSGGLLVMQIPSYVPLRRRLQAKRRLYAGLRRLGLPDHLLYKRLGLHPIPMNFLPEAEVRNIVQAGRARLLKAAVDRRAGPHIESRTYYITK